MYARLKKQSDFKKMFARGKRVFSPALLVLYLPAKEMSLGVCVSKKHGKSVVRNRIKRLLREAFRKVCPRLKGSYACILLPRQAEEYTLAGFEKSLRIALKREGLL